MNVQFVTIFPDLLLVICQEFYDVRTLSIIMLLHLLEHCNDIDQLISVDEEDLGLDSL